MKTGIYWQDPKCAVGRCRTDPGCVLYLPLHSLDGASFMSKDAYGHLCTVTGALWTPRGRSFDGLDDDIDCGNAISLRNHNSMTIEGWLNINSVAANSPVVSKFNCCNVGLENCIGVNGYKIQCQFRMNNADHLLSGGTITLNAWYHIAVTLTKGSQVLYLDGQAVDSDTLAYDLDTATANTVIGRGYFRGATTTASGLITGIKLRNRALTALEIQHNYLATKWRYQ